MVLEWEVLDKTPVFAPFVVYCLLFMNFQEGISLSLRCASFWVLTLFLAAGVLLIWSLYFYCMKIVDICDPTVTFLFTGYLVIDVSRCLLSTNFFETLLLRYYAAGSNDCFGLSLTLQVWWTTCFVNFVHFVYWIDHLVLLSFICLDTQRYSTSL